MIRKIRGETTELEFRKIMKTVNDKIENLEEKAE